MHGDVKFNQFGLENGFELELQAKRAFPIIRVDVIRCDLVPETDVFKAQAKCLITRWIKSPFHVRAREYSVDAMMPVGTVAASFFGRCVSAQTVLTLCHNRLIDPRTLIKDINAEAVLEFRCCCLPGELKMLLAMIPKKPLLHCYRVKVSLKMQLQSVPLWLLQRLELILSNMH